MLRFLISFALILQLALTPAFARASRPHNAVINNGVSNLVHGQDFFDGLDQVGRTFLVTETIAIAQFGIGELGNGSDTQWEGSIGHLLLHGGVGCLALEALNGDCVAGFFSGASSSLLAGSNLTDEQKLELASLVGAFTGYLVSGGNSVNVAVSAIVSRSGIQHNYLSHIELVTGTSLRNACNAGDQSACTELTSLQALDESRDQVIESCIGNGSALCQNARRELREAAATHFEHIASGGTLTPLEAAYGNATIQLARDTFDSTDEGVGGTVNIPTGELTHEQVIALIAVGFRVGNIEQMNIGSAASAGAASVYGMMAAGFLAGQGPARPFVGVVPIRQGLSWGVVRSTRAADIDARILVNGIYRINPTRQRITANIGPTGRIQFNGSSANGRYMYVVQENGTIIIGVRAGERMPHPTLVGGTNPRVQAAGIVDIRNGRIFSVDNISGHFRPSVISIENAEIAFGNLPRSSFHVDYRLIPYIE